MPQLEVVDLGSGDVALAWPLVRANMPELKLDSWRALAQGIIDRGGGIVAVLAPSNTLQGVATYEAVPEPKLGQLLYVNLLVAFELSRRAPVRRLLRVALDMRARTLGCLGVVISSQKRPRPRSIRHRSQ